MKARALLALSAIILLTAGCADYDDRYAEGAPGPEYDVYYDGYFGPYPGGYWGDDGYFYYSDDHGGYLRDDAHHFRHERFGNARPFVSQHHDRDVAPRRDDH
jgi:hypothetical protein